MAELSQAPMLGSPELVKSLPPQGIDGSSGTIHSGGHLMPTTEISDEAERFAKGHGLWGSLRVLQSLLTPHQDLVSAVRVDLVSDPEVSNWFTLRFCLRTTAGLPDDLELDNRLRDLIFESIPAADRIFFAMQFQFDSPPDANGC